MIRKNRKLRWRTKRNLRHLNCILTKYGVVGQFRQNNNSLKNMTGLEISTICLLNIRQISFTKSFPNWNRSLIFWEPLSLSVWWSDPISRSQIRILALLRTMYLQSHHGDFRPKICIFKILTCRKRKTFQWCSIQGWETRICKCISFKTKQFSKC